MSEEINLLDEEINNDAGPKTIPVFLKVLCILTFVGAGIGILSSLGSVFTMGKLEENMRVMDEAFSNSDIGVDFGNSYRWTKISYILNLIGSLLCLAGALIMWKLRKYGYYIYIFGQVLPLIASFMVMNSMFSGVFGGFTIVMTFFGMLFPIAFIIMYGLNLKHMR